MFCINVWVIYNNYIPLCIMYSANTYKYNCSDIILLVIITEIGKINMTLKKLQPLLRSILFQISQYFDLISLY